MRIGVTEYKMEDDCRRYPPIIHSVQLLEQLESRIWSATSTSIRRDPENPQACEPVHSAANKE